MAREETSVTKPMDASTRPRQDCRASEHIPQKVLMFPLIHPGSGSYPLPEIGLLYLAEGPTHGPSAGVFTEETSKRGMVCPPKSTT